MGREVDDVLTTSAGRRVGYLDRGPADGLPVVYLHGMPGCRLEQRLFPADALERAHVRLISVDRPGWGRTDARGGDRIARVADVLPVCDALGIGSFSVLAVSSGGGYAVTLAAVAPDRVERVVLASAQMPYDDERSIERLLPDQRSLLPLLRRGRTDALVAGLVAYRDQLLADPVGILEAGAGGFSARERALLATPWFRDAIAHDIRTGVEAGIDGLLADLLLWPQPLEVSLDAVRCPVRALHGEVDDWEPLTNLRRIVDRFDDSVVLVAPGMNHLVAEVLPDVVLSLLRT